MSTPCYIGQSSGDLSECLFSECSKRVVETPLPTFDIITRQEYEGFQLYSKEIRRMTLVLSGLVKDIFAGVDGYLSNEAVVRAFILLKSSVEDTLRDYTGDVGVTLLRNAMRKTADGIRTVMKNLKKGFDWMIDAIANMSLESLRSMYRSAGKQIKDGLSYLIGLMTHVLSKIKNISISEVVSSVSRSVSLSYSEAKIALYSSVKYISENKLKSVLDLSWYVFMGVLAGIYFFLAGIINRSAAFIARLPRFISFIVHLLNLIYSTVSTAAYNTVAGMLGYEKKEYGKVWNDFTNRYDSFSSIEKDAKSVSRVFKSLTNLIKFVKDEASLSNFMSRFYYISEIRSGMGIVSGMVSMSDISLSWVMVSIVVCFKLLSMIFGFILYYGCLDVKCADYINNDSEGISPEERVCREKCWNASSIRYEFPLDLLSASIDFNAYLIQRVRGLQNVDEEIKISYLLSQLRNDEIEGDLLSYISTSMGTKITSERREKIDKALQNLTEEDITLINSTINRQEIDTDFSTLKSMIQWYENVSEMELGLDSLSDIVGEVINDDEDSQSTIDSATDLMLNNQPPVSSDVLYDADVMKASVSSLTYRTTKINMNSDNAKYPTIEK